MRFALGTIAYIVVGNEIVVKESKMGKMVACTHPPSSHLVADSNTPREVVLHASSHPAITV